MPGTTFDHPAPTAWPAADTAELEICTGGATVERAVETAVRRSLGTLDSAASLGFRGSSFSFRPGVTPPNPDSEILRAPVDHDSPLFAGDTSGGDVDSAEYATAVSTHDVAAPAQPIPPLGTQASDAKRF